MKELPLFLALCRKFLDPGKKLYQYSSNPREESLYPREMGYIHFELLGMPAGIWLLQIPVLIRLTCSFFVGYHDFGLPVRRREETVAKYWTRKL